MDDLERDLAASMSRRAGAVAVAADDVTAVRATARRRVNRRRALLAGASAALALATVGALVGARRDPPPGVASGAFSPLIPSALPTGFVVASAGPTDADRSTDSHEIIYRDGPGARRAVVQTQSGGSLPVPEAGPGQEVVDIAGRPALLTDYGPQRYLTWQASADLSVAVTFAGVGRDDAIALSRTLRAEPVAGSFDAWAFGSPGDLLHIGMRADVVPSDGFRFELRVPDETGTAARRIAVQVAYAEPVWLDYLRTYALEQAPVDVAGASAVVLVENPALPGPGTYATVVWWTAPGVLVEVDSSNLTVDETIAVARSLRTASADEWAAFVDRAGRT